MKISFQIDIFRRGDGNTFQPLRLKLVPDQNQFRGILIWQGPNEQSVDQADDSAVRANRQRECKNGNSSEAGRFYQLSERESEIGHTISISNHQFRSFHAQGFNWIYQARAPRRQKAGNQGY